MITNVVPPFYGSQCGYVTLHRATLTVIARQLNGDI